MAKALRQIGAGLRVIRMGAFTYSWRSAQGKMRSAERVINGAFERDGIRYATVRDHERVALTLKDIDYGGCVLIVLAIGLGATGLDDVDPVIAT